jgi:hypothetical protein
MPARPRGPESAPQHMAIRLASDWLVLGISSVWSENKLKSLPKVVGLCVRRQVGDTMSFCALYVSSSFFTAVLCCLSFAV